MNSSPSIDLEPAAQRLARLIEGVPEEGLTRPTPCEQYTIGDLLDHIAASVEAFLAAASKEPSPGRASGDAGDLPDDWRTRMPSDVRRLAELWRDPEAWTGMTQAAGVELPAEMAGVIALDELVIHGWDLAQATGQPPDYDGPGLEAVLDRVQQFRASGVEGLFGPEVPISSDAPLFDRVLAASGRDPAWSADV